VPAVRLAADHTRPTTLERLVRCLDDLGGVGPTRYTARGSMQMLWPHASMLSKYIQVSSMHGTRREARFGT
jgi:hypothetical protein